MSQIIDAYDIYEHVSNLAEDLRDVKRHNEALHEAVRDVVHTLLASRRSFIGDAEHREIVYQVSMRLVALTTGVKGIK